MTFPVLSNLRYPESLLPYIYTLRFPSWGLARFEQSKQSLGFPLCFLSNRHGGVKTSVLNPPNSCVSLLAYLIHCYSPPRHDVPKIEMPKRHTTAERVPQPPRTLLNSDTARSWIAPASAGYPWLVSLAGVENHSSPVPFFPYFTTTQTQLDLLHLSCRSNGRPEKNLFP